MVKVCTTCRVEQPATNYHRSRSTTDGYDPRCKPCRSAAGKTHNVDTTAKRARMYGLTVEDYQALRDAQADLCAICHQPETMTYRGKVKLLSIDHDHTTGKVRGLLCAACNFALGKFKDNPTLLRSAADYLER